MSGLPELHPESKPLPPQITPSTPEPPPSEPVIDIEAVIKENNELKNHIKRQNESGRTYQRSRRNYSILPDNEYSHARLLIKDVPEAIDDYDQLLNPHLLLGAVKDDKLMRLYQNDFDWVVNYYTMAQNDDDAARAMWIVFRALYQQLVMEIRFTATKGGKERAYQSHFPQGSMGMGIPPYEEDEPNIIDKFLSKNKRRGGGQSYQPRGGIYE